LKMYFLLRFFKPVDQVMVFRKTIT